MTNIDIIDDLRIPFSNHQLHKQCKHDVYHSTINYQFLETGENFQICLGVHNCCLKFGYIQNENAEETWPQFMKQLCQKLSSVNFSYDKNLIRKYIKYIIKSKAQVYIYNLKSIIPNEPQVITSLDWKY